LKVQGQHKNIVDAINPVYSDKSGLVANSFGFSYEKDSFSPSPEYVKLRLTKKINKAAEDFANKGKNLEAAAYYNKSIAYNPDYTLSYYSLARIYKETNRNNKAIETYELLLERQPQETEAQTLLGHCYKTEGHFEKAQEAFQKVCGIDPHDDYAARSLKEINNMILEKKILNLHTGKKTNRKKQLLMNQ